MKDYENLDSRHANQPDVFAFFPYKKLEDGSQDYDASFIEIAKITSDCHDSFGNFIGLKAWEFEQERFQKKYAEAVPKLKNYLRYTFKRLRSLEQGSQGKYFLFSSDREWVCFNTGLQDKSGVDLIAVFEKNSYKKDDGKNVPDWFYKGCWTPTHEDYEKTFGINVPELAWYTKDSRDFVFDTDYHLHKDIFSHLLQRARERVGFLETDSDEKIRNYLRGALEYILPKIRRNYKIAIPVYYFESQCMQLLLPFESFDSANECSCFLVERNDDTKRYALKTILDLDHAYFAARLIARPDKEWLNP